MSHYINFLMSVKKLFNELHNLLNQFFLKTILFKNVEILQKVYCIVWALRVGEIFIEKLRCRVSERISKLIFF